MTELTIALNFIIIFLLVTAIIYGFILNRRINLIRESSRELSNLFRSFDDTILNAQNSVEDLKRVSTIVSDGLQKKIDRAALIIDDLEFLKEKSEKAADSLGVAVANYKKIENRIPAGISSNGKTIIAAPLPLPSRSSIPAKPLASKGKRALADLLEDASGVKDGVARGSVVNGKAATMPQKGNDADKRQFSIASALKALGYGE